MKTNSRVRLIVGAGLVLVALLAVACGEKAAEATRYHCPMHPTYISDKPGDCPICGMRLVPMEWPAGKLTAAVPPPPPETGGRAGKYLCPMHPRLVMIPTSAARSAGCGWYHASTERSPCAGVSQDHNATLHRPPAFAEGRKPSFYRNPMDPSITSPVPKKDSMGMDYIPVYAEEIVRTREAVSGMAPVEVAPEAARLAGVQVAVVERAPLGRTIRTVGTVVADETRIRPVHTKISGWVERLFVNFTGQAVRAGEPILAIYSQELLASQEEFLRARETAARFADSQLPEVRRGGEDLLRAARRRLELFDVPTSFIAELERTGQPQRTVTLLAPVSGYVTAKATFEGHQVEPGMELFTITDLSRVWIEADFYEYEAAVLALGETAALTLPYDPTVVLSGRIAYIYPTLDAATRTLRVRFEFPNPRTVLKPGMFANVELTAARSDALVIPDSAVMDTGERQVVFVAGAPGRFEPREVKIGVRSEGWPKSSRSRGGQVVTRANFLLDPNRGCAPRSLPRGCGLPPTKPPRSPSFPARAGKPALACRSSPPPHDGHRR
jgi:RND family efflux transporter MFP subunit